MADAEVRRREPPATDVDVSVVDYGLGNLRSVTRGLERAGATVELVTDPESFDAADGLVLPGVGAFREGMDNAGPYREALTAYAESGRPLFGICLGMQMLLTTSEEADHAGEGEVRGLDLIPGRNLRFDADVTVPQMGWNQLQVERAHPLVAGFEDADRGGSIDGEYAYFVHSYYTDADDPTVAATEYGNGETVEFSSVVANESRNVIGTQFHPEKSGETGLSILRNFVEFAEGY